MDGIDSIDGVRKGFIERMGVIAQTDGMPRMCGQIFAMLVFDGDAVAFGELARQLEVSRATVSTSIRLLEDRGLVRRVNRRGDRQDYFQLADNAYVEMLRHARVNTGRARDEVAGTLADLPAGAEDVRSRLQDFASFYGEIEASLGAAIDRMEKAKT